VGETYNIGGNNEQTNMSLVTQLCSEMDKQYMDVAHFPHDSLITHVADRPGHDRRYAVDTTKITTELGYQPVETFETGMRKTLKWYLENLSDWEVTVSLFGVH
jgi:dTDP-glucose 4,6-dehydratase